MTKTEFALALEGLKDSVNDSGKRALDALKANLADLQDDAIPVIDRRAEERDPFEKDQRVAEDLGLAPKVSPR